MLVGFPASSVQLWNDDPPAHRKLPSGGLPQILRCWGWMWRWKVATLHFHDAPCRGVAPSPAVVVA